VRKKTYVDIIMVVFQWAIESVKKRCDY